MKFLRKFETPTKELDWLMSASFVTPNVLLTEDIIRYNEELSFTEIPLYVEAIENLSVKFSNTYEYSRDNEEWTAGTSDTSIEVNATERVFFRATGLTASSVGIGKFTILDGKCNLGGNIMSMLHGSEYVGNTNVFNSCFARMFQDNDSIVDASNLKLPATSLRPFCYSYMFFGCASLKNAPELPAVNLAEYCYQDMFRGCSSLTIAPELPATTLAESCYTGMFTSASLTTPPKLPATTLERGCYYSMFFGNTKLTYAPDLPATSLASKCYERMFCGCHNLIKAPKLPATTLTFGCYWGMFDRCTSLENAPDLPATKLEEVCYYGMFYGCSKLNYIKMLATDISARDCLTNCVYGVSPTGTFVKNSEATWDVVGINGVPEGWTVEYATT